MDRFASETQEKFSDIYENNLLVPNLVGPDPKCQYKNMREFTAKFKSNVDYKFKESGKTLEEKL